MPSSELDLPREAGEEAGELPPEPVELDLCTTSATISLMRRPRAGGRIPTRRRDASELERDAKGEVQMTWSGLGLG